MPKVSIWLTSYNHGELLRESIESALNQTYQDYELVIVDDCSTDNSREIIREYAQKDSRIRMVFHEKNIGHSGLKEEVDNFAGEYVAILCGDDKWKEDKLEKQVEVLEWQDNVAACFTGVQAIGLDGKVYTGSQAGAKVFQAENRTRLEWLRYFFYHSNCLCHPSLLIRKKAYKEYGILKVGLLTSLPDFYEWVKLCFHADIHVIPEALTLFRIHEDETSQSGETEGKLNRTFMEEYYIYQTYFGIHDTKTLTDIFPESREYVKDKGCVAEFALAKIFLKAPRKSQKLLGLNKIGELLEDEGIKRKLEDLYGYGEREFNQDKQKYDIFGYIGKERFLRTSLFVDTGAGYREEECIKQKVFIPGTRTVRIVYDLGSFSGRKILRLRFDPDEEMYRICSVMKAWWEDGEDAKLHPANGVREDGRDCFYTLDPQYEIRPKEGGKVLHLILKADLLPAADVERHREMEERKIRELEQKLKEAQAEAFNYRRTLGEQKRLLDEYRSSISIRALHKLQKGIHRRK